MYDGCFGLNRRPFASVPQIDHYFAATVIEGARTTLTRCVQRGEGAGLVIGPAGAGKTLLCLMLAEQFQRSFQVVKLPNGRLSTRRNLFQAILYELGRPYRGMDEGETRLAVVDYLMGGDETSRGMVLIVDEAHTLPLRLLEEIRLLTNLVRNGQPLVRAVLAGGPVLEERFASPKLDSFSQRLGARCYLEALNRTETEEFIHAQINAAGGLGEHVFPKETCQSVFQATGGVPRLVNQVCDHALLLAYVAGRQRIEPANVEEAWSDLQQLPTPWSGERKDEPTTGGGVIEFGALDDQDERPSTSADVATASMPALRISPAEDEPCEIDRSEPAQQIRRIERLLAEADDDFQPAGSIGPEIELYFEESAHPFQEEFEHEEVVADRYAAASSVRPRAGRATEFERADSASQNVREGEWSGEVEELEDSVAALDALTLALSQREREPDFDSALREREPDSGPAQRDQVASALPTEPFVAGSACPTGDSQAQVEPQWELVLAEVPAMEQDWGGAEQEQTGDRNRQPPSCEPKRPTPTRAPMRQREYKHLFAQLRRG